MPIKHSPKRQMWMIVLIVFLGFVGLSMPYLIFPVMFFNPEYTFIPADWTTADRGIMLGVTLAAYPIGQFIGSPILGALSDDYGRRKIMSSTLLIAAICNLLTAFSLSWGIITLLIFSRFVAGLMEGNLSIARAMAADIKELNKLETFGKVNAAASISYIVGPLMGGLLSDRSIHPSFTLSTPFYLITTLFLGLSLLTHFCLEKRAHPELTPHRSVWSRLNLFGRLKILFENKNLKFYLIIVTVYTLAVDIFFEFGPVYLTILWDATPSELAAYNASLAASIGIGCGYFLNKLAVKFKNHQLVSAGIGSFALVLFFMTIIQSEFMIFVLFSLAGLAIGVASTTLTVQISDSASEKIQGEVMGVQTSLRVLGDAMICLMGGILLMISPKIIIIIASAISLTALFFYAYRNKAEARCIAN